MGNTTLTNGNVRQNILCLSLGLALGFSPSIAHAQKKNNVRNSYLSETDKNLTVHSIGVLPSSDNVNGLYSRNVENKLASTITDSHRFTLAEIKEVDPRLTLDDYEAQPALVRTLGQKNSSDAFVIAKIIKSEKNMNITLDLFLASDGLLLATEKIENDPRFQLSDLDRKIGDLYDKSINKLPYKGLILSRQNQRVTIDIGLLDGVKADTVLTVEQIISVKRHPKFNFILTSEKEIIGKIKIVKAEQKLSFAIILNEKESGVITKDSKVSGIDFVSYAETDLNGNVPGGAPFSKQDQTSFGKNPHEWRPDKQPSLGFVGIGLGLGSINYSTSLQTSGSFTGQNAFYPQLQFRGELWLTQNWYLGSEIREGLFSMGNPLPGSNPGTLTANDAIYDLHVGYKFLLQDDFWGPQLKVSMGFYKYSLFVDSSTPLAFTSTSYNGLNLAIGGMVPLDPEKIYVLEAQFTTALFPSLQETPLTSGAASSVTITTLGIGGSYKLTNNFKVHAMLDFDFYSATFTGVGTRGDSGQSSSQTLFTLLGGLDYYF